MPEVLNRRLVGSDVLKVSFDGTKEIVNMLGYKSGPSTRKDSTENIIRRSENHSDRELIIFLRDGKLPKDFTE